jgi:hypothetical protein
MGDCLASRRFITPFIGYHLRGRLSIKRRVEERASKSDYLA